MPSRPLRPCPHPGCHALVRSGRCAEHKRAERKRYDDRRGSSAQRGYGYRWQQERGVYLAANPLCVMCKAEGRTALATVVDHIIPHRGDQALFWDAAANWQSLCAHCHSSRKQSIEKG